MKRYINFYHKFFLVATILATCTLTACDEAEELSFNGISLSEEQLDFGADGGKYTIALNASQEWTVMSDREWCLVNPANGNGSTTCEITVDSSYLYKEREAHLTFRCGKYSRQILIHQLGYEKVIKLDKDLLEVPDYTEYDKMFETVKALSEIQKRRTFHRPLCIYASYKEKTIVCRLMMYHPVTTKCLHSCLCI
jgi:hypothetical protein